MLVVDSVAALVPRAELEEKWGYSRRLVGTANEPGTS